MNVAEVVLLLTPMFHEMLHDDELASLRFGVVPLGESRTKLTSGRTIPSGATRRSCGGRSSGSVVGPAAWTSTRTR
jgi:hypothetical protein